MSSLTHEAPRQTDRGRAFLSDHPLRAVQDDAGHAVAVTVRLTSYRSLPLSCLERIELSIDGVPVDQADLTFVLGPTSYRLDQLGLRSDAWWFILEEAELVARLAAPLGDGDHVVEGTLVTVEPYVSNGRFHFTSTASRRLSLVAAGE